MTDKVFCKTALHRRRFTCCVSKPFILENQRLLSDSVLPGFRDLRRCRTVRQKFCSAKPTLCARWKTRGRGTGSRGTGSRGTGYGVPGSKILLAYIAMNKYFHFKQNKNQYTFQTAGQKYADKVFQIQSPKMCRVIQRHSLTMQLKNKKINRSYNRACKIKFIF